MGHERTLEQVDDELDEMCLRTVRLMDDYCASVHRMELCLRNGCVLLAKSRYVMGNSAVSAMQLPSGGRYSARSTIVRDADGAARLALGEDGDDPVRRFGVLVPASLRAARESFCGCLESAAEAASIKNEMERVRDAFAALKRARNRTSAAAVGP